MTQRYRFSAYLRKTPAKVMIPAGTHGERESFLLRDDSSANSLFTGVRISVRSPGGASAEFPGCVNTCVHT